MGSKSSGDRESIKSAGSHSRKNSINAADPPGLVKTVSKETHKLHGKTDPNAAINEVEPSMDQLRTQTSLAPIREIQFRDLQGNIIREPDASNPSRPKFERPLDTIRGFEERIRRAEREERAAYMRADSESAIVRRGSYYGGSNAGAMTPRVNQYDSYYGGTSTVGGPKSVYRDSYNNHSGYFDGHGTNGGGGYPNRQRIPRTQTEPMGNGPNQIQYQGPYANNNETMTNGSGSGSSGEPLGYQTDPSSDNSSFDRGAAGEFGGYTAAYNGGAAQNGHYPNVSYSSTGSNQYTFGNENGSAPPPPPHKDSAPRAPIKLGTGSASPTESPGVYVPPKPEPTKRKSWLSRKFSTKG